MYVDNTIPANEYPYFAPLECSSHTWFECYMAPSCPNIHKDELCFSTTHVSCFHGKHLHLSRKIDDLIHDRLSAYDKLLKTDTIQQLARDDFGFPVDVTPAAFNRTFGEAVYKTILPAVIPVDEVWSEVFVRQGQGLFCVTIILRSAPLEYQ